MHENTYNEGDKYNMFDYQVLDKRINLFKYLKSIIAFRKKMNFNDYVSNSSEVIEETNYFTNLENNSLLISLEDPNGSGRKLDIVYNPSEEDLEVEFIDSCRLIIGEDGYIPHSKIYVKKITLPAYSVYVFEGK